MLLIILRSEQPASLLRLLLLLSKGPSPTECRGLTLLLVLLAESKPTRRGRPAGIATLSSLLIVLHAELFEAHALVRLHTADGLIRKRRRIVGRVLLLQHTDLVGRIGAALRNLCPGSSSRTSAAKETTASGLLRLLSEETTTCRLLLLLLRSCPAEQPATGRLCSKGIVSGRSSTEGIGLGLLLLRIVIRAEGEGRARIAGRSAAEAAAKCGSWSCCGAKTTCCGLLLLLTAKGEASGCRLGVVVGLAE